MKSENLARPLWSQVAPTDQITDQITQQGASFAVKQVYSNTKREEYIRAKLKDAQIRKI